MKVADYIFKYLESKNVKDIFMVAGGHIMYLMDALYQNENIKIINTHHEQAASMSAEAYGRITGDLGVALVTVGPGSINAINGLVGGWLDSSPMLIISGQSNLDCVLYQQKFEIRQYGLQDIDIRPFVEKSTKYFTTINNSSELLYHISKAYYLATTGRPGPVWLSIPLNIQRMEVDESVQREFVSVQRFLVDNDSKIQQVINYIKNSQRPVFIVGQGVRISKSIENFLEFIHKCQIPVITSRLGIDIIESDNKLYVGRPGNYGERSANFAIQNADLIISVGCRLASSLVGHNPKDFGRNAKKIVIDIDENELNKPGVNIDLKIKDDCKNFFIKLNENVEKLQECNFSNWIERCQHWKEKYPVVLESYKYEKPINSYYFISKLSEIAREGDMVLVDIGSCFHVTCQTWKIKNRQRFLTTGGLGTMGYWAAGIGVCLANNKNRTIVITGDGSLQMNIQEFATIAYNNLPIKVFVFNNNGYLLIRHTQNNFMDGHLLGESPKSGVWCPDSLKIANAYGIKGIKISDVNEIEKKIKEVLDYDGPVICDILTSESQLLIPRISSDKLEDGTMVSKPYEDMFPFLDRQEFHDNMIIKSIKN